MFFVYRHAEQDRIESIQDRSVQRLQLLHQALYDKFGPGNRYAYDKFFDPENYEKFVNNNPNLDHYQFPWSKVYQLEEASNLSGVQEGLLGVKEAPVWYQKRLQATAEFSSQLEEAFQTGLYIPAPGEAYFDMNTIDVPNFLYVQRVANALRQYSMHLWAIGEREAAIKTMGQIIQVGDIFRADPTLIAHLIRVTIYETALTGMSRFLWLEPSLEELQQMQDVLNSTDVNTWAKPDHAEQFIWFDAGYLDIDRYAAALLVLETETADRDYAVILEEAGVLPTFKLSKDQVSSVIQKWTTLPAMKKRLQNYQGDLYANDSFLSEEQAKQLPTIWYAAYRYQRNPFGYHRVNASIRFENARARLHMMRQAVWARIQKEQTGEFPTEKQFIMYLQQVTPTLQEQFHGLVELGIDYEYTKEEFKKIHFHQQYSNYNNLSELNYPVRGLDQWDKRKLHYSFEYDFLDELTFVIHNTFDADTTSGNVQVQSKRDDMIQWTQSIFNAFKPIVKSTTLTKVKRGDLEAIRSYYRNSNYQYNEYPLSEKYYNLDGTLKKLDLPEIDEEKAEEYNKEYVKYLSIELDLPKEPVVVRYQGPNKQWDDYLDPYDPSNGINSGGDIYQFVGWK